jgi:hypothetical protein
MTVLRYWARAARFGRRGHFNQTDAVQSDRNRATLIYINAGSREGRGNHSPCWRGGEASNVLLPVRNGVDFVPGLGLNISHAN